MLVEYQLKFEKNGLTITQRVEPSVSGGQTSRSTFAEQNYLRASFQESKKAGTDTAPLRPATSPSAGGGGPVGPPNSGGGGPVGPPNSGGGPTGFGTAPVTFIGPFIMCCPSDDSKSSKE